MFNLFRLCRNSKGRNFTKNSFDIVAVLGNKAKRCCDIVAGVDGALEMNSSVSHNNVINKATANLS